MSQRLDHWWKVKEPTIVELLQTVEELAAEDAAQGADGKQETRMGCTPALPVAGQSAARDQAMDVEVSLELLVPGVQDHGDARLAAEMVAAELEQGLGGGLEEQVQQDALIVLVTQDQGIELMRQREDVVEIGDGEQFRPACFEPLRLDQGL